MAILKILDDIHRAADNKTLTCLLAFDLSAMFDTIDHRTHLDRLHFSFGLNEVALSEVSNTRFTSWIRSYLTERTQ